MGCVSEDDLLEYVERRLHPEAVAAVEAHVRGCDGCRRTLAELAQPASPEGPAPEEEPSPRYEALEPIGAGGMGVVYAARDLKLRRTVALKMLRPGGAADAGQARVRERLLREARAMARLSHPNVLSVYDVGELGGDVFLTMELVEGATATAWLQEKRRSWREVLEVFLAAARGLAAAHAAGIIHRDFKPDNLLVGEDGRVRVTDFGLASALASAPSTPAGNGKRQPLQTWSSLSAAGATTAFAGSPAYMAPEQLRGEKIDARADVFSYSVALYEAVYGERPFAGESLAELEDAIRQGRIQKPRRGRRAPSWLRRAVLRGLRHDPAERFQSMDAVLSALVKRRRRRRQTVAVAVVSLLAALTLLAAGPWRQRLTPRPPGLGIRSLAVLPLEDLSGDTAQPSFADTVSEALATDLGRTQGLRVTSRRSAEGFRGTKKPLTDVGRELGVDGLLRGSVQRTADQIRIDLRLVRAPRGEQVWSRRFEGAARDGLGLEDEAARAVRAALGLVPPGDERSLARATRSAEALELWARGRIHLLRENLDDDAEAIRLLERAVAADPTFAPAQADLSHAYGLRVNQFAPDDAAALERAEAAAHAALRLDPDLAEAHYATAYLLWGVAHRFWHERAARELERALELNPNLADAHHLLGTIYGHVGLLDRSLVEFEKTLRIDPTDSNARRRMAIYRAHRGEYEEALRIFREVPEQSGANLWGSGMVWTLQHLGRTKEAFALTEERLRAHPEDRGGILKSGRALLYAQRGDARRATADIRGAIEKGQGFVHFHHTAYNIAAAYALLGKPDDAVRWLRWAAENGFPCYPLFATDPNLDKIRHDPAYVAFMNDLRAQWERYRDTL